MIITVHKKILCSLTAFAVMLAVTAPFGEVYAAEDNGQTISVSDDDFTEDGENTADTEESDEEEDDDNEPVKFSLALTSESEDGAGDGKIKIVIENGSEDDVFFFSMNGGMFRRMKGRAASVNGLSEGCYSVCVKKNNNDRTLSETKTVYVSTEDSMIPVRISSENISESIYRDAYIKVFIEDIDREKSYEASVDGGKTWKDIKGRSASFRSLEGGSYKVVAREKDNVLNESAELDVKIGRIKFKTRSRIKQEVPMILQKPELPTGCEITSLAMLLQFHGFEADKLVLADDYLPKGEYRKSDFRRVFVGDPRNYSAYGCFSPAIVKAAKNYIEDMGESDRFSIRDISGCRVDSLYSAVDKGNPVMVWATMNMRSVGRGASWILKSTGETLVWPANEHCLLLTGYDSKKVYVNDPLEGAVSYDKKLFEKRFAELENQAVIILKK